MKRILYVTSKIWDWCESQSCAEHFAHAPYSIDAIGYNLEKLGWTVALHPLIERLAADPSLCNTLADNAAHDIPVYTWAEIAQKFEDYFKVLFSRAAI